MTDRADQMADALRVAFGGIEVLGTADQLLEVGLESAKLADGALDLGGAGAEQFEHVAARRFALVPESDDPAYLAQREPDRLGGPDEPEPAEDVPVVDPVAGRVPRGWVEQADVFVVAERLRRDTRAAGDLSDQHDLTFQCTGSLTVAGVRIDILYVPDCPNLERVRRRLHEALAAAGIAASVCETEVATAAAAERVGMRGSPTILIDGRDPFGPTSEVSSLSCRLYATGRGVDGAPDVAQLVEVVSR